MPQFARVPCLTTPHGTKVLLVDDQQLTRSLLRGLLKDAGFTQFREATDAATGIRLAGHFAPDLICLDVQMPGISGMEAIQALKDAAPRAAVLMVSANNDRETVLGCLGAGAHGYIIKPFNASTVLRSIEAALAKIVR
jgi:two-component system chemotaxis response regulator CheY